MKSGCPVLCTNVSSIGEVFGDVGFTAKNSDVNEYEQLLRNLFESNYRNETVRKGIDKSMSFSWDRNFSQLTEIYKRL
jgi:glycosyltransferase involved in cell wall biosynthesis